MYHQKEDGLSQLRATKDKEKTATKKTRQLRNSLHQARSDVVMYKRMYEDVSQMHKPIKDYHDDEYDY